MPISISGSGSITGINAGGLPDGCVTGDDIANNTIPAGKLGTTEQSQLCRAWVNFNGTGVVAIRASYNVSSITDMGTGNYKVNFTAAMPDANYSYATQAGNGAGNLYNAGGPTAAPTSTDFQFGTGAASFTDLAYVSCAIFR